MKFVVRKLSIICRVDMKNKNVFHFIVLVSSLSFAMQTMPMDMGAALDAFEQRAERQGDADAGDQANAAASVGDSRIDGAAATHEEWAADDAEHDQRVDEELARQREEGERRAASDGETTTWSTQQAHDADDGSAPDGAARRASDSDIGTRSSSSNNNFGQAANPAGAVDADLRNGVRGRREAMASSHIDPNDMRQSLLFGGDDQAATPGANAAGSDAPDADIANDAANQDDANAGDPTLDANADTAGGSNADDATSDTHASDADTTGDADTNGGATGDAANQGDTDASGATGDGQTPNNGNGDNPDATGDDDSTPNGNGNNPGPKPAPKPTPHPKDKPGDKKVPASTTGMLSKMLQAKVVIPSAIGLFGLYKLCQYAITTELQLNVQAFDALKALIENRDAVKNFEQQFDAIASRITLVDAQVLDSYRKTGSYDDLLAYIASDNFTKSLSNAYETKHASSKKMIVRTMSDVKCGLYNDWAKLCAFGRTVKDWFKRAN